MIALVQSFPALQPLQARHPPIPAPAHQSNAPLLHKCRAAGEGQSPGFIGNIAYSQRNLFGLNQKLTASVEMGQSDALFRLSHLDPWVRGDTNRTSRNVQLQNTRASAASILGAARQDEEEVPGAMEESLTLGRMQVRRQAGWRSHDRLATLESGSWSPRPSSHSCISHPIALKCIRMLPRCKRVRRLLTRSTLACDVRAASDALAARCRR